MMKPSKPDLIPGDIVEYVGRKDAAGAYMGCVPERVGYCGVVQLLEFDNPWWYVKAWWDSKLPADGTLKSNDMVAVVNVRKIGHIEMPSE